MPAAFNTTKISAIVACICDVVAAVPEKFATTLLPVGVPNPVAKGHDEPPVMLAEAVFVFLLNVHVTPPPSANAMPRQFPRKFPVRLNDISYTQ